VYDLVVEDEESTLQSQSQIDTDDFFTCSSGSTTEDYGKSETISDNSAGKGVHNVIDGPVESAEGIRIPLPQVFQK